MHSSPEFRSLKAKIRMLCKQRRIRLEEFMKTFDIHRVKKIKTEQFKRALDVSGLHLSATEISLLLAKYRIADDPCFVDYRRFCDLMDKVFTVKGLEAKPKFQSIPHGDFEPLKTFAFEPLTPTEEATLAVVKQKLLAAVMNKGIVLKDVFHDFDRSNAGKVTRPQFVRDISDIVVLSSDEMDVLLKAYGDKLDVHYRALHFDICPGASGAGTKAAQPRSPERRHLAAPSGIHHSDVVQELEAELSDLVLRDRIRTKNFFTDFDPLRTGKCTEAQFRRCVKLCFPITFVDDVESVFTVKGLEKNPHHDLKTLETREGQFGGVVIDKDLTPAEEEEVKHIMLTMKRAIDRQRMEIKPTFEDFDRSKQGFISATKFERVLSMLTLLPAKASDLRLLLIKFREQAAIGTTATLSSICDVNYRAFLQALQILGAYTKNASSESIRSLVLPGSVAFRQEQYQSGIMNDFYKRKARDNHSGAADLSQLLAELRRQLSTKRIRLKEFIVEGDKLRSGEITVAKFHTALNRSGCVLDADDIQTLSTHFRSARNPDKIDWRSFLGALDFSHGMNTWQQGDVDDSIKRILEKLRNEVNHRRLHMKPYFQDYDHNNVTHITKFQFAAVLDMMQVSLKPAEVQALTHCFAHRDGRKLTNDVNYLSFIQAVDSDYS
ncbi:Katanin p60 ATPase-containing subunit A 1 [Phytophthora nicotianae]|uniref:Katanin p60 ATPase-containing subunit A 1 n=1 Tax=Phytophthora nicotianae TaxID=4792 RepID=A0A0W8DKX0_PHYNI|nr:Katanin p60 ATPase-containing subunit A 1 [Phytophthora nicotianae]